MEQRPGIPLGQRDALQAKLRLESQLKAGVNNFYWIAGLSLLNTVLNLFGSQITFVIGLGITMLADLFSSSLSEQTGPIAAFLLQGWAFAFDLGMVGLFVGLGLLSTLRVRWAYILGMVLYALDALIMVWLQMWVGLGFHLLILLGLLNGYRTISLMEKMQKGILPPLQVRTFGIRRQPHPSSVLFRFAKFTLVSVGSLTLLFLLFAFVLR